MTLDDHRPTIAIGLVILVSLAGCASTDTTTNEGESSAATSDDPCQRAGWRTFESEQGAWSFCYPPDWERVRIIDGITSFAAQDEMGAQDGFGENMNIVSQPVDPTLDRQEVLDSLLSELRASFDVRSTTDEHDGRTATTIIYERPGMSGTIVMTQRILFHEDSLFVLTYAAQAEDRETYLSQVEDAWSTFEPS